MSGGFEKTLYSHKLLWDANHTDYCNKIKRNDALERIGNEFNIDVSAVKIKIKNLRSFFSKERQKSLKRKSGSGADETYVSLWFAYTPLLFVADNSTPREIVDSEQEQENPKNSDLNISTQKIHAEFGSEHSTGSHSAAEEHEFVQPIRTKRSLKKSVLNDREEEAYKFMKKTADSISEKDESTKRNITNWLLNMQMKEMEANMIEERRMLPHESPATSNRTFESENSSLTFPIVEG
ncbi:hypothetical protein AGLY_014160, partial [Aphis glycines]